MARLSPALDDNCCSSWLMVLPSVVECEPSWHRKHLGKSMCPKIVWTGSPGNLQLWDDIAVIDRENAAGCVGDVRGALRVHVGIIVRIEIDNPLGAGRWR